LLPFFVAVAQGWTIMNSTSGLRCLKFTACGIAIAFAAASASAQTAPNLVGTWKGKSEAVYVGPTPYRGATGTGPNFGDAMEYTYVVKEQKGTRFSGEITGKITETIIGTMRPPEFRSGIIVDNDGFADFTLRDAKTMDVCYHHIHLMSKVAACFTLEKQP
jgi:hypothetical protein